MPIAATSAGRTCARPSASTATPICDAQISCGSCSTHPGEGKICVNSFWATPRTAPLWSKTIARAVHRRFPWAKVLPYSLAQIAGAFAASVVVFATYHEALGAFDGGVRQVLGPQGTGGIWATYPQPFLSVFPGGFIDQIVGTALLVGVIFGITDSRNSPAPSGLAPLVVGLLVVLIGATFGFNSGYAINPARDLGPRLFTAVAGWGGEVFRAGNSWWWVPVVAPPIGGVLGGWVYDACVGNHFP